MDSYLDKKELVLVMTAEADFEKAQYLADNLLLDNLVSCIGLQKINSHYFWDGKLQRNDEVQLLIKTNQSSLNKVLKLIKKKHSYELPELLFWSVSSSKAYGEWTNSVIKE
tara:strand:- start:2460 stop:2792 length:333 start_codon:yes stop_codon:yes gene_type:complete